MIRFYFARLTYLFNKTIFHCVNAQVASEQIQSLQDQNSSLRTAVAQMRQDMEGLSRLQHQPQPDAAGEDRHCK